ncbi:germ cell nuclear acidic protein-like isoform X2 [Prorops nasuta]|uniref:germ cell nuclear acidic protein-like isoform X2 n=1 Tax=Prorops nasuta TaxID=863751 RepID=UPI0034CD7886
MNDHSMDLESKIDYWKSRSLRDVQYCLNSDHNISEDIDVPTSQDVVLKLSDDSMENDRVDNFITNTYHYRQSKEAIIISDSSPECDKFNNVASLKVTNEDELSVHPAITDDSAFVRKIKKFNRIINETSSESELNIDETSKEELLNYKSKIIKDTNKELLETPKCNLSERKKKQICKWLDNNSVGSCSDDSISYIPPSQKNSGSGNSSLERLEKDYETPNNRNKFFKYKTPCQTIDRFPERSKKINLSTPKKITSSGKKKNLTSYHAPPPASSGIKSHTDTSAKGNPTNQSSLTQNSPTNVDVKEYTDILDKLYGNVWREKANLIFSEKKKLPVRTIDRAVQTEKKCTRSKTCISDLESDTFSNFAKGLKPQLNSTKRTDISNHRRKDSFINDDTLSGEETTSIYHTALTDIKGRRSPEKNTPRALPNSVRRVLAICDSDSDSDNERVRVYDKNCIHGRRLSFDEDETSSTTSEYDPGDIIPRKETDNKEKINTGQAKTYITPKTVKSKNRDINNYDLNKPKTFLESLSNNVPIEKAHPDAKRFRIDFKKTREELCKYLFKLFNEKVFDKKLPSDLPMEWSVRMTGTAGFCYNKKIVKTLSGIIRSSRIVLSTKVIDTSDRLRDTLIHEMCHAAVWLLNGTNDNHGPLWRSWATKAMEVFPELPRIKVCHDYKIKTKFTYKCTGCGYSIGRHSKSLDTERKRCGICYGKFELLINRTTKSGRVELKTPGTRGPSKFALYVKEHYSTVKKERNVKHAEIMKILGY